MEFFKEYMKYTDIFSKEAIIELLEYTGIHNHLIDLRKGKQPPYRPIYSLELIELEILKIYIEDNLKNGFVRIFKSSARVLILFVKKTNVFLWLYIDYQELNNFIIKNWYPIPFIDKLLDYVGQAKHFMQLDLTSAYYWMRIREGDK